MVLLLRRREDAGKLMQFGVESVDDDLQAQLHTLSHHEIRFSTHLQIK